MASWLSIRPALAGGRCLFRSAARRVQCWVARITTTSNILGYLAAATDLQHWAPWYDCFQFQLLCRGSSISLAVTVMLKCLAGQEDALSAQASSMYGGQSLLHKLSLLYGAFPRLYKQLKRVGFVQFFPWTGWYPFQSYTIL